MTKRCFAALVATALAVPAARADDCCAPCLSKLVRAVGYGLTHNCSSACSWGHCGLGGCGAGGCGNGVCAPWYTFWPMDANSMAPGACNYPYWPSPTSFGASGGISYYPYGYGSLSTYPVTPAAYGGWPYGYGGSAYPSYPVTQPVPTLPAPVPEKALPTNPTGIRPTSAQGAYPAPAQPVPYYGR